MITLLSPSQLFQVVKTLLGAGPLVQLRMKPGLKYTLRHMLPMLVQVLEQNFRSRYAVRGGVSTQMKHPPSMTGASHGPSCFSRIVPDLNGRT